jgi:hypothetical protein
MTPEPLTLAYREYCKLKFSQIVKIILDGRERPWIKS